MKYGCRAQESWNWCQVTGAEAGDGAPVPDTVGYGVWGSLCWPASGHSQGLACPRVGSGLLWVGCVHRLCECGFLVSHVCPLMVEAGLEANTGFLEGTVSACPLMDGAGSWPSDGQGHV